jgi:hypothetical protein
MRNYSLSYNVDDVPVSTELRDIDDPTEKAALHADIDAAFAATQSAITVIQSLME